MKTLLAGWIAHAQGLLKKRAQGVYRKRIKAPQGVTGTYAQFYPQIMWIHRAKKYSYSFL
jgi:hypothetical protein